MRFFWKERDFEKEIEVYKIVFPSILTYYSETWNLKSQLQTMEKRYFREINLVKRKKRTKPEMLASIQKKKKKEAGRGS